MRCLVVSWDRVMQNWSFQMSILMMDRCNMWCFVVNWCLVVHWGGMMRSLVMDGSLMLGCFMMDGSLVVHWSSVMNWCLVMDGSLVVDWSFMMNWGSVVNWCFVMNWCLVVDGSFMVDWSGVVSNSLMMDWGFVMYARFVMGSLVVSDSWVLRVMLLSSFWGVLVMCLLGLVLDHWDRHVLVRFSRVMLSLMISWLMVTDDRFMVHWRFMITLMSVLLVGHELLEERLGNFDIFDMFGGLVMRSDNFVVDRSGFVVLRCCWHFNIPDLWLFVSVLSTMWLLWHFNVSRSRFGVVRLLDILWLFDVMRLLDVVGLLGVSGSVHWLLNVTRFSIHRLAVVSLMWLSVLVWHVVVAVLGGGGAGFFS